MNDLLKFSSLIKNEADELLKEKDILEILRDYGEAFLTGSVELDLMYKKDIDITMVSKEITTEQFFEMGGRLAAALSSNGMFYRNSKITPIPNRPPNSLYWGIKHNDWMFDIWVVPEDYANEGKEYIDNIKKKLNDEIKLIILSIKDEAKKRNEYGRLYSSKEVYRIVLEQNVKTFEEFKSYL